MSEGYLKLNELLPYRSAIELGRDCWKIYESMNWEVKKIIGSQFITAVDSIGTNIAEGYGRFHFLDRIKFYYNARGSLVEAKHWMLLLKERNFITEELFIELIEKTNILNKEINTYIKACRPKE